MRAGAMARDPGVLLRRALAVTAGLAVALGAAACTGADEDTDPSQGATEPGAASEPGTATETDTETEPAESSDAGGAQAPLSDADLDTAAARFVEALQVLDDRDWETACGYVLDPATGTAPVDERLQECTDSVAEGLAGYEEMFRPGTFDALEPSLVVAREAGDGTVRLTIAEQEMDILMVRGTDHEWYLSIPF